MKRPGAATAAAAVAGKGSFSGRIEWSTFLAVRRAENKDEEGFFRGGVMHCFWHTVPPCPLWQLIHTPAIPTLQVLHSMDSKLPTQHRDTSPSRAPPPRPGTGTASSASLSQLLEPQLQAGGRGYGMEAEAALSSQQHYGMAAEVQQATAGGATWGGTAAEKYGMAAEVAGTAGLDKPQPHAHPAGGSSSASLMDLRCEPLFQNNLTVCKVPQVGTKSLVFPGTPALSLSLSARTLPYVCCAGPSRCAPHLPAPHLVCHTPSAPASTWPRSHFPRTRLPPPTCWTTPPACYTTPPLMNFRVYRSRPIRSNSSNSCGNNSNNSCGNNSNNSLSSCGRGGSL